MALRTTLVSFGVLSLLLGLSWMAAPPAAGSTVTFTLYSGAAGATTGGNGEGPIASGLGGIGNPDPLTTSDAGPVQILFQYGGWNLIPGTQWVSYANTTFSGPPNGVVVSFFANFTLPDCFQNASVTVSVLADDVVTVFLNGNQLGAAPLTAYPGYLTVGTVTTSNTAFFLASNSLQFDVEQVGGYGFGLDFTATVTFEPCLCPHSQGFWKNHPAAWPATNLTLGNETYNQTALLALLQKPPKGGDASLILAHQLIAAKLNVAAGSNPAPVAATVATADVLLSNFTGPLPYGVQASTTDGQQMTALAETLDDYNSEALALGCVPWSSPGPADPKAGSADVIPPGLGVAGLVAAAAAVGLWRKHQG